MGAVKLTATADHRGLVVLMARGVWAIDAE